MSTARPASSAVARSTVPYPRERLSGPRETSARRTVPARRKRSLRSCQRTRYGNWGLWRQRSDSRTSFDSVFDENGSPPPRCNFEEMPITVRGAARAGPKYREVREPVKCRTIGSRRRCMRAGSKTTRASYKGWPPLFTHCAFGRVKPGFTRYANATNRRRDVRSNRADAGEAIATPHRLPLASVRSTRALLPSFSRETKASRRRIAAGLSDVSRRRTTSGGIRDGVRNACIRSGGSCAGRRKRASRKRKTR